MVKVIVCGPPHSGKSIFIHNLISSFSKDECVLIHAYFEEDSIKNDENIINIVKQKGEFTTEFVQNVCKTIDEQNKSIVLIDVGGIVSPENEEIFKHCTDFIVISNDVIKKDVWVEFGEKAGLNCIAALEADINVGGDSVYNIMPYLEGKVSDLESDSFATSEIFEKIVSKISERTGSNANIESKENEIQSNSNNTTTLETINNKMDSSFNGIVIDNFELAQSLDLLKSREISNGKKIYAVNWTPFIVPQIYSKIKELVKTNLPVRITEMKSSFMMATVAKSCIKRGINDIAVFDECSNRFIQIVRFKEEKGIKNSAGLEYTFLENQDNVFLDIKIHNFGSDTSPKYYMKNYQDTIIPEVNPGKKLFISGRIPNYLLTSIVASYNSREIYVFVPGNGFLCIASNDESVLGKLFDGIDGMNLTRYFEDLRNENEGNKNKGFFSKIIVPNYNDPNILSAEIKKKSMEETTENVEFDNN